MASHMFDPGCGVDSVDTVDTISMLVNYNTITKFTKP